MSCCCACGGSKWGIVIGIVAAVAVGSWVVQSAKDESEETAVPGPSVKRASFSDPAPETSADPAYVLGFTMNRIDGTSESLDAYKGKVVLIVNVASKCGLTPQYEALEKLYQDKKDEGFVVLGFPANDFRGQEPGTNQEIAAFCSENYGVTFPMFEKISVLGEQQHPLYRKLVAQPDPIGGDPKWNFTKFLVDRSGKVAARFEPRTKPEDAEMVAKIDELLAAK